jgi:hypothetical protein
VTHLEPPRQGDPFGAEPVIAEAPALARSHPTDFVVVARGAGGVSTALLGDRIGSGSDYKEALRDARLEFGPNDLGDGGDYPNRIARPLVPDR